MSKHSAFLASTLALVFAAAALSGCTASAQSGLLAVYFKDAPADDFSHVYVTFTRIEAHKEGVGEQDGHEGEQGNETDEHNGPGDHEEVGDGDHQDRNESDGQMHDAQADIESDEANETQDSGKWLLVSDQPSTIDLRAYNGTAKAFAAERALPAGEYGKLRVTISHAEGVLSSNGTTMTIQVPSHPLRIGHGFTVTKGNETAITLDFDLSHAIVKMPDGQYVLRPELGLRWGEEHHDEPGEGERSQRRHERDQHDQDNRGHDGGHQD
jgi:hypothetical protein